MGSDKKAVDGKLRLVLLRGIGQAVVTADFDSDALRSMLEEYDHGPQPDE
jgi:3-dehydroquinate synthase